MGTRHDVLEKLFDKVNVCHDHAAAAVSFAAKLVHSITNEGQFSGCRSP